MVFESVVVDVLNRFLGDYVVNLDTSQLSLGIWAGNRNLISPPVLPLTEPALPSWGPRAPLCPAADSFGVLLRRTGRPCAGPPPAS